LRVGAALSFRLESRFSTWLERIAVNEARMRLRRLRNHKSEPLNDDDANSDEYVPFVLSDWREIPSEALERKDV
jgi:RNA polymerase sigma-70 factor (ECF subfamily)